MTGNPEVIDRDKDKERGSMFSFRGANRSRQISPANANSTYKHNTC
jgi:hypothetical protein